MNNNLRTAALIAAGIVSAGSVARAEEAAKTNPVETALTSTTISGYVSTSALFNLGESDGGVVLPGRVFDPASKVNQINLDVVSLAIEKPLDESDWAAGYKAELLFGQDANLIGTTSALAYGGAADNDFAIKQAYVTLKAPVGNDLIAKIGVFDAIIGYEVFDSIKNPNYSRSYAYYIEPFQHTGLLLSYQLTDWLSVNAGIADTWDSPINAPGIDSGARKDFGLQTYMGSMAITIPKGSGFLEGMNIYGGVVHGLSSATGGGVPGGDGDPRTSVYGGLTIPTPIDPLKVGLAYDYRFVERYRAGQDNAAEYATTMAGYVTYALSKQLNLGVRGEYATGSAGSWGAKPVGGPNNEEFFGLTTTLDYNLWANVLTRFEFRWDTDLSDGPSSFGSVNKPDDNAYIIGLNVAYKF